ncbi:ArpU family phage packaging/lysis transcriptional regulator [Bacillus cytotoxicus]|uniref:Phage transcriptional regulator, ArpU family n=1 Tax=Bacillus cytotoxicus (strain DSM 22905 / CIP 110041 / 391-98 / NVH 391-98) TaxID=315749 RepID=A7GSS2_BACCN|nr:ArpU family phage packaging/lysis transcriptional regulator [Bacillus cytotoxicus]ABS23180.1 phage transcriptional regulator, ArpU family [Bacillus cytotoxicus NVH 391-98]MDH2866477.1 ArpU family transcriptional regulator [Bacillus cytotoxicus]NZD32589.1 ArpU family transcriptional regulator [Bacillus cytotoxicus]NZD32635.1 ArpU family transcriptional regulator [Bacillus cytotoxicus]QTR79028.1 ArpU family transcriptional regulator [Bacillus cytotoxicus]
MLKCAEVFMNMELDIDVPVVNMEETKKNVLKALKKYRLCQNSLSKEDKKRIISMVENGDYQSIEHTEEFKQCAFMWKVEDAVSHLNFIEKQIIQDGYMTADKHNWVKMSQKLNLSKTPYYEKRDKAFERLAKMLKIVVYY